MKKLFDISPYSLPNCADGELRFEEPRDISQVIVTFAGRVPKRLDLFYMQNCWPKFRCEQARDGEDSFGFGWMATDDWFNCQWQKAAVNIKKLGSNTAVISFLGLTKEFFKEAKGYDVDFRRTYGLKIKCSANAKIKTIKTYTKSEASSSVVRVELDAGRKTKGKAIKLSGYNALVKKVNAISGVSVAGKELSLGKAKSRSFTMKIDHMDPSHSYCGDVAHLKFELDKETFTVSLSAIHNEGPVWYADEGVYITLADDPTHFATYRANIKGSQTISEQVLARREQSYAGAFYGQPRPHAISYNIGCKHARQCFWLETNGDLVFTKSNLSRMKGKDTAHYKNKNNGRFFFGLEEWMVNARFTDPAPVPVYNINLRQGDLSVEQKSLAVPLLSKIQDGETKSDETMVALLRFRFKNSGDKVARATLPINYSSDSSRSYNGFGRSDGRNDNLVPISPLDKLSFRNGVITSAYKRKPVFRGAYETSMKLGSQGQGLAFNQKLQAGESCEVLLKIPYVAIAEKKELKAIAELKFNKCLKGVTKFWRQECANGSQIQTPETHLNSLYASHLTHVELTDIAMTDDPDLVNVGVGTSTYGNYSNESCMIVQELEQRGLHEETRRRLDLWVKYQGTVSQPGNFTDYDGMYYGAGGFEDGYYNQHHGWILWCLAEHFLITQDRKWFDKVSESMLAGAEWIFRQRRNTMSTLPHSRGWEYGFLPAGSLEDVTDYHYWLSTNVLTWRGAESAAKAFEKAKHPAAKRLRAEADSFRADLIKGFETMRQHSPLVRLNDGRWVPNYPSRQYCRGRDYGWIREVLEGSIYLIISGLYDAGSKEAQWILDDYQDTRYIKPPYAYHILDWENNFFHRGGISMQPNLLAGLMPYLDRDEPELYIWMFFNAWLSCYREEINGMCEHPAPVLGYSNSAHFKTSDEANAIMWLRYMYVYATSDTLYLGRAIPRDWLKDGEEISISDVSTYFGKVSLGFKSDLSRGKILLTAKIAKNHGAEKIIARLRHPEKKPIKSVKVNGKKWTNFCAEKENIDLSGFCGKITVECKY